jgi:hypothetical protein
MRTRRCLAVIAILGSFSGALDGAWAQPWIQTSAPITNWSAICSAADGTRLAAAVDGGSIYTSSDSGETWVATAAPIGPWRGIASSADGTKLVAAAYGGPIYTSADSGATWIVRNNYEWWRAVASSADGNQLVAVSSGNPLYPAGEVLISQDAGVTWTSASGARYAPWVSVASSADGTKLAAVENLDFNEAIYTSADAGATWTRLSPNDSWTGIASSADGTKLVAAGRLGIQISTNSGAMWSVTGVQAAYVASSADGSTLVAAGSWVALGIPIFTSTDAGATWTTGGPVTNWASVASSADGAKLVAVVNGGGIYTSQTTSAPALNIAPTGSGLVLSWTVPSMEFLLQQNSDLTTTNWTDVGAALTLNFTNLQYQAAVPGTGGARFYRLKH